MLRKRKYDKTKPDNLIESTRPISSSKFHSRLNLTVLFIKKTLDKAAFFIFDFALSILPNSNS